MTGDISLEKQFCEYLDRGDSQKAGLLVPELSAAARAPDGTSLLFKVIEKGTPDVLLQLLTKGFSLNVRDAKGNSPSNI